MRRLLLGLIFAVTTTAVSAAGWESGMVEDEGGPVMMAWIYGEGGDVPPELRMMCGDQVNLRYGMGSGPGEGLEPIMEPLDFTFTFGAEKLVLSMQYEGMDGMYAAYFPPDAPIVGLLQASAEVSVDDPTKTWHDQSFILAGSSAAIGAMLKTCQ